LISRKDKMVTAEVYIALIHEAPIHTALFRTTHMLSRTGAVVANQVYNTFMWKYLCSGSDGVVRDRKWRERGYWNQDVVWGLSEEWDNVCREMVNGLALLTVLGGALQW
jgi:hypothetical protein